MFFYLVGIVTVMYFTIRFAFALFDYLKVPNPFIVVFRLDKKKSPPAN